MKENINILGFLCEWCAYQGADLAGTSRLNYPAEIKLIKVPCSGRVSGHMILKAFQKGADAVFVAGCHPGDCHFKSGNIIAQKRIKVIKSILDTIGIEPLRLDFFFISASEGLKFKKVAEEFYAKIEKLGPSKLKKWKIR
jgi:coenzyme F420-reducing hydrogenase delta subunit